MLLLVLLLLQQAAANGIYGFYQPKGGPTPRCGPDGGFVFTNLKSWPARGNFLDEGLALGIASLLGGNATSLLDVGSGQYGAYTRHGGRRVIRLRFGPASTAREAWRSLRGASARRALRSRT